MRLKDPFSLKTADMTKRSKKPRDEDSSDEVGGKKGFSVFSHASTLFTGCLVLIEKSQRSIQSIYQALRIYRACSFSDSDCGFTNACIEL